MPQSQEDLTTLTAEELTRRMQALEDSGQPYEAVVAEYEALSQARAQTGWTPEWVARPLRS